jgi:hypothetical protein
LQFLNFGRRVAECVWQHAYVDVTRFQSAIADLQKQLVGQDREHCQLTEANVGAKVEHESQLEGLPGAPLTASHRPAHSHMFNNR